MAKKSTKTDLVEVHGLRIEERDPRSLRANARNWRTHPQRQRQTFRALLEAHGWTGMPLLNETTGNLIDGHMRVDEAIKMKLKTIPVLIGRWTETEERHILATHDPLGAMASTNAAALQSLTEEISHNKKQLAGLGATHAKTLQNLTRDLSTHAAKVETGEAPAVLLERISSKERKAPKEVDTDDIDASVTETKLKDDAIFPSNNEWGIPDLTDNLCTVVPTSTWNRTPESVAADGWYCYSAGPNTFPSPKEREGGILGFFTEDFRFEMCWNDPAAFTQRLVLQDWAGVCLPDYSTWSSWPFPIRLHNLYRSRWCGRYWQEAGIPIVPIIQSFGPILDDVDPDLSSGLLFETLPSEIPVAAIQVRTAEKGSTDYWASVGNLIKLAVSSLRIETLVIYGGIEYGKYLNGHLPKTKKTKFVPIDAFITKRREVMRKTK